MLKSEQLYQQACQLIPGGVNSPVRAFRAVGGNPRFIARASGAYLYDSDQQQLIDYVCSWGAILVGHAHPQVVAAIAEQARAGLSYGAPTELESQLASKILSLMPGMEMLRMVNSGTEATMTALRLARGYTGKNKIIKFNGCYHGHSDCLLVQAGSGGLTLGKPNSAGVPPELVASTLTCDYNDCAQLEQLFGQHSGDIAAVIIEPIAGNMNFVRASSEFIAQLSHLCQQHASLLICDEVMTGFRVGLEGAQGLLGIKADITCLGKVIGGGMPAAALGGSKAIMQHLAPSGDVYQAGTLAGNPIAMRAGLASLELISADTNFYSDRENYLRELLAGWRQAFERIDVPMFADCAGAMFGFFPGHSQPVSTLMQPSAAVSQFFRAFHLHMLRNGVYLAPSMFEAGFITSSHEQTCLQQSIEAAETSAQALAQDDNTQTLRSELATN